MKLVVALAIASACVVSGQSFGPVRYLGEIGHLETPWDQRRFADFGFAKAFPAESGIRIEGRDDRGKPWHVSMPVAGGIGWTDVWRADFDANSRPDLMIAASFPGNGRCIQPVTITFLMFDSHGRPVPWTIETFLPNTAGQGKVPAIVREFNHKHHAEFVATGCQYSEPNSRFDEDRTIEGIYEAEDAHWKSTRPMELRPYSSAVRANYSRGSFVNFLPAKPEKWRDHSNLDSAFNSSVTLREILRPDRGCRGVRLPIVDGRVVPQEDDPCEIFGKERFEIEGGTIWAGWPSIVVDGDEGREIVGVGSATIESKLREIAAARSPVISSAGQIRRAAVLPYCG